jgi:hypothetical protein
MANRKGKVKLPKSDNLVLRAINQLSNGMAVIATETPIERWDDRTQQVVKEVLLMDGCRFRGGRDQIPIVDSHDDSTVGNVLGSIQRMRADASTGELYGYQSWASTETAQEAATLVSEGHLTDFSITAQPITTVYVQRGQIYTTPRGALIEGPAIIHTEWEPHNASICATGADVNSVVRRSYTDLKRKVIRMDEALMGQLSALGLPEGMTDPNQVLAWVVGKLAADAEEEATEDPVMNMAAPVVPVDESPLPKVENTGAGPSVAGPTGMTEKVMNSVDEIKQQIKRALDQDQVRRKEIQAACTLAKVERAFADELCDKLVPLSEARKRIIERMATQPLGASVGGDVRVTASEDDKFFAAARDGLILRAARQTGNRGVFKEAKPAEGAEDFQNLGLNRLAEQVLLRRGINTSRMNTPDIAKVAMGNADACRRYRVERHDAYHSTGSFTNLMLDAANKTLLAAYDEAPFTWNMWARQAPSVPDFKTINRIRFSESPNLEMIPERQEYPEKAMTDSKESYSVNKYGASFSVSWETIVNDDLDAISRIPAMHGNAARREQNRAVYAILTANANLSDGGALFNTTAVTTAGGHANQSASAAVISSTTLNAAYASMMVQKGLNSNVILNIQPRFLIVPAAISHTALQFVNSIADPGAGGNVAGNSNTLNIYGPQGMRNLQVIIEPQLDGSSTSVWYLAADSSQIDTVELTFLQGEESPVLESEWDLSRDVYLYKIRQTFAAKAIDYRGLYRNA